MAKDIAGLTKEQLQRCLALGGSLADIRSLAAADFSAEEIEATLSSRTNGGGGVSAGDLKELLQAQRKAVKPENDRHPGISVFSTPEGEMANPKPAFAREVFMNGAREKHDQLSPQEVALYNRFDGSRSARNGMWQATIKRDGSSEQLLITTEPNTLDGRLGLPPLTQILRELLDGEAMANPDLLAERVEQLEAQIKGMAAA